MTANRRPETARTESVEHARHANSAVGEGPVGSFPPLAEQGIAFDTKWEDNPDMDATNAMARNLFGRTALEAIRLGECIRCAETVAPDAWDDADRREYFITALCPTCWDVLFPDE